MVTPPHAFCRIPVALRAAAALLACAATVLAAAPPAGAAPAAAPGELLVGYTAAATAAQRSDARDAVDATVVDTVLPSEGRGAVQPVHVDPDASLRQVAAAIDARPGVAFAEPNYAQSADAVRPTEPDLTQLWGLHNTGQDILGWTGTAGADMGAYDAWAVTAGDPSQPVAIFDTGIDTG